MNEAMALDRADALLRELGLNRMADLLPSHAEEAARESLTYTEFIARLLDAEMEYRYQRYTTAFMKLAARSGSSTFHFSPR